LFIIKIDAVRLLGSVVHCLLPKMRTTHQVGYRSFIIVYYQKCGLNIRFDTICVLGNVVDCLLPKLWTNH